MNLLHASLTLAAWPWVAIGFISVIGAALIALNKRIAQTLFSLILCFSIGIIGGNLFFYFIPESYEHHDLLSGFIIIGFYFILFWVDKIFCRHQADGIQLTTATLIGDSLHKLTDGFLVASMFGVSNQAGLATLSLILLHEIPFEISKWGLFMSVGITPLRSILISLSTFIVYAPAFFVVNLLHEQANPQFLMPLTTGALIFLLFNKLIPKIKTQKGILENLLLISILILGIYFAFIAETLFHSH